MDLIEFAAKIGLNKKTLNELQDKFPIPTNQEINAFYLNPKKFIKAKSKENNFNSFMLYFHIFVGATKAKEYFNIKGFSDKIYYDTLKDIALWSEVYHFETGEIGLAESEINWLISHQSGQIVTLNRLQYKPSKLEDDLILTNNQSFKKALDIIEIHIPRGTALTKEAVEDSLNLATKIFGENRLYSCYSWLLSPVLKELLPNTSNILNFAKRFEITSVYLEDMSGFRYLNYAAETYKKTSLTNAAKKLYDNGKALGCALGFFIR